VAAALLGLFLFNPNARCESPIDGVLRLLLGKDSSTIPFDLDRSRPAPVPHESRARVLDSLPKLGLVKEIDEPGRRKLESLAPVLHLHQRESVYEIRVYEGPPAFVGLHGGAVVLVSAAALRLLTAEELQAQVAHEIGHEYVWGPHHDAEKRDDAARLKASELFCDGVAILTLRRMGVDPDNLISGLRKTTEFNRTRFGIAVNADHYPSFDERKKFAQVVIRWTD
jgi:hypothetical protein